MLAKSKFFKKNQSSNLALNSNNQSYMQVSKDNIKKIVKIKDTIPKLSFDKVTEIYKVINNSNQKDKPKFNIMTKGLSRKQIIISTSINNVKIVTAQSNTYIVNINRLLKEVKSEISADYIHFDNKRIVIITNKTVISSNLNIVEKYIKELNYVDSNNIISPRLLQSKSYFKILDILYFLENTNLPVMSDIIERVIKSIHIFNNMVLVSCS